MTRATITEDDDPALDHFLSFLRRDLEQNPERFQMLDGDLVQQVSSLITGIEVDLNSALSPDDE